MPLDVDTVVARTSDFPRLPRPDARRDVQATAVGTDCGERCIPLFWSRNASASPWVRWEYDTARQVKKLDALIPMPLEDPKIAPPPPEFADEHMRDRFMVARYALAQIDQVAARAGDG